MWLVAAVSTVWVTIAAALSPAAIITAIATLVKTRKERNDAAIIAAAQAWGSLVQEQQGRIAQLHTDITACEQRLAVLEKEKRDAETDRLAREHAKLEDLRQQAYEEARAEWIDSEKPRKRGRRAD